MLKVFELFALCLAAGPCNNCIFFDRRLSEDPCTIGCPNSWPLFDILSENGRKNREIVLDLLNSKRLVILTHRKENKND